jgi:hypothetical protein
MFSVQRIGAGNLVQDIWQFYYIARGKKLTLVNWTESN